MTANIVFLQLAVLGVILESDLGRRKVGWFRVLRPAIAVVLIVPFFFTSLPTARNDLLLQGAGALAGVVLGLFSVSPWFVSVGYDPDWRSRWSRRDRPPKGATVSHAGAGYALIWIAVTAIRLGFAYGSQHWFPASLGQFMTAHQLSATALTNAFIFLSIGMDLLRSVLLAARARRARGRPAPVAVTASLAASGMGQPSPAAAVRPAPGRPWTSELLTIPLLFVAGRLGRQLDRREDHPDRRARRRF